MDSRSFRTPQKPFHGQSPAMKKFVAATKLLSTPQAKFKGPETPKSLTRGTPGHFSLFPISNTPPSRFPKIINPFEAALTERLHLPLICSPSLFQRPSTPQHSSTQFEWTIDEVSSLGPVNVEPHETQFQATPDPDLEAKAQAAISSYFKDQIIVPSPVDCQRRNRKIVLHDSNDCSPAVRPGRRIRDGHAQTVMSIPPIVPLEVENMLKIFFTYTADQQQSPTINCDSDSATIDYEAQDISLRRKLFGVPSPCVDKDEESCDFEISEIVDREQSPPPVSPDLDAHSIPMRGFGSPFGKNSFGSLSPISKVGSDGNSPKRYCGQQNKTLNNTGGFVDADFDFNNAAGTPKSPQPTSSNESVGCSSNPEQQNQSLFRSTPDRSIMVSSVVDMSVDRSYNKSTNRLAVNSSKKLFQHDVDCNTTTMSEHSSFIVIDDDDDDDDGMQISQLSAKSTGSSSGSSQHPDTPVRKHRSASRKNLSRSFSCPVTDDEDEDFDGGMVLFKKSFGRTKSNPETMENRVESSHTTNTTMDTTERSVFYRTDSGFNEMTTQDESKFRKDIDEMKRNSPIFETDVSMC